LKNVKLGYAKPITIQHRPCGHLAWLVCYKKSWNYVKCKVHEHEIRGFVVFGWRRRKWHEAGERCIMRSFIIVCKRICLLLVLQLHVCICSKISMRANNGVHKTDEVCTLEVCVCYL
jgi:hypothetical protein